MNVTLVYGDLPRSEDLRSLREWVPRAAPRLQVRFVEPDPDAGDHLGLSLTELTAVLSSAADLITFANAVRGWVRNQHGRQVATEEPVVVHEGNATRVVVGPVTITVTDDSGTTSVPTEADGD